MSKKNIIILHLIIFTGGLAILLFLANQYFVPWGQLKIACIHGRCSKLIDNENSNNQAITIQDSGWFRLNKNPWYFSIALPRNFHAVRLSLELNDYSNLGEMKWGIQRADGQYNTKILYSGTVPLSNCDNNNQLKNTPGNCLLANETPNSVKHDLILTLDWEYIEPLIKNKKINMYLNWPNFNSQNNIVIKKLELTFIKPRFQFNNPFKSFP